MSRVPEAAQVPLTAATEGLGTGGDARLGALAAHGAKRSLASAIGGCDLVFVVGGMAGGTGGGAAPELARHAREQGAVVVGFAIMPFGFEAGGRQQAAEQCLAALRDACDTCVLMENDRALGLTTADVTLDVALRVADDVLRQAVQGLGELLSGCGWINLDLATMKLLLSQGGEACIALGVGRGETPALTAVKSALASPLSDMTALRRASAVLIQVSGGPDLSVAETAAAIDRVRSMVGTAAELVVGTSLDPTLCGAAQVTILATGLRARAAPQDDGDVSRWTWPQAGPVAPRSSERELPGSAVAVPAAEPV
jgi:cell division protein FtsZ